MEPLDHRSPARNYAPQIGRDNLRSEKRGAVKQAPLNSGSDLRELGSRGITSGRRRHGWEEQSAGDRFDMAATANVSPAASAIPAACHRHRVDAASGIAQSGMRRLIAR